MNLDHKNIDKLFESGLSGYKTKAPAGAWDRLNSNLNGLKRRKAFVMFRWAAAAILILFAFGAGYFYATFNTQQPQFTNTETMPASGQDKTETETLVNNPNVIIKAETETATSSISDENKLKDQKVSSDKVSESKTAIASLNFSNDNDLETTKSTLSNPAKPVLAEIQVTPVVSMIALNEIEIEPEALEISGDVSSSNNETTELVLNPNLEIDLNDYYTPPTDSRTLKWTIGAQFAPTYSYRDISTNYNAGQNGDDVSSFNSSEDPLLSYAGGVNIAYAFNSKWSLNSGMYFSRIGQVNTNPLEFSQDGDKPEFILSGINTSTGAIDFTLFDVPETIRKLDPPKDSISGLDPINVKIVQNFDLFEVPFMVQYHLLNKKFMVNFSGGLSPAYLVRNNNYIEFEDNRYDVGSTANLNNFVLNSSFGLGLGYQLTKKLTINFEPTFKYSLSPINSDSKVYYHPYYLSWFTGINYRF